MRVEIPLREKIDRQGRRYLFGSVEPMNMVVFVYVDGESANDKRPMLIARPYKDESRRRDPQRSGDGPEFDEPWKEAG